MSAFDDLIPKAIAADVGDTGTIIGAALAAAYAPISRTETRAVGQGELMFNVKDYGATGQGTSSDRAAAQAALNAARDAGGGTVYFPNGTYAVDGFLLVYSGTRVVFGGRAKVIGLAPFGGASLFVLSSRVGVRFEGGQIDGNNLITYLCNAITCTGLRIEGTEFYRTSSGSSSAVRLNGGSDFSIKEARFDSLVRGVHGTNNGTGWLSHGVIGDCYFTGMADAATYFTGNADAATRHIRIKDVLAEDFAGSGTTRSGIYFTTGSSSKHDHITLENVDLKGRYESFVSGSGNSDLVAFYDMADSKIIGGDVAGGGDIGISLWRSDRVAIVGATVRDNHTPGICLWDTKDSTVTGAITFNNRRDYDGALTSTYGGVLLRGTSAGATSGNAVTGLRSFDNQATKTQDYGVVVEANATDNLVAGNVLKGNSSGGILDLSGSTTKGNNVT